MSERRSISFNKNESELLKYYDDNGKSDIAKIALKFYIENKDKVINEGTINLIKALSTNQISIQSHNQQQNSNLTKLKK